MRYEMMDSAVPRPGDAPSVIEAILMLTEAGYDVRRPENNDHQLKITPSLSYYATRGTLFIDGQARPLKQRGLKALLTLLRRCEDEDAVELGIKSDP